MWRQPFFRSSLTYYRSLVCLITLVWTAKYANFDWSFDLSLLPPYSTWALICTLWSRSTVIVSILKSNCSDEGLTSKRQPTHSRWWLICGCGLTSSVWNFSAQPRRLSRGVWKPPDARRLFSQAIYQHIPCQRALNKNGYDQKNEPTLFLPSGVHTKSKPKINPNPKLLGFFWLVLVRATSSPGPSARASHAEGPGDEVEI